MLEWLAVGPSSNIARVGHDSETQQLTVEFKSGGSYSYSGVDAVTAADLAAASSPGEYFHRHVRGKYPSTKL